MKMMKIVALLLGVLAAATTAFASVEKLDTTSLETLVAGDEPAFVKMYAPWCGHCKRLAPAWETLSEEIAASPLGKEKKVHIASVDCTEHRDACAAHNVRGYPTLLFFKGKGAEGVKYQGARDVNAFTNWLGEQA